LVAIIRTVLLMKVGNILYLNLTCTYRLVSAIYMYVQCGHR